MTDRKRILFCESNIDGTIGGSFYSLLYLADGLNKDLYDPKVIFYTDNALIPRYRESGIEVEVYEPPKTIHLRLGGIHRVPVLNIFLKVLQRVINFYRFMIREGLRKARYLRNNRIDLVHLNNSIVRNHDWMLAARLARVKCITHERGINRAYPLLARFFSRHIDGIICISSAVKEALTSNGIFPRRLEIIHNGLDPDQVRVRRDPGELKREFGILEDMPVVGMIGNIKEWKGQEVVIRAIDRVRRHYPDIRCLLVGDMSESDRYYQDRLTDLIDTLGLEKNIVFTGYQSNVADFINIFDVMIHASIDPEPFGRVLVEGMALSRPLVGSRDGAVPEIVQEGETGLMFRPGDHEELATALVRLLDDPEAAAAMGRNGRQRLEQVFHIDRNIERTEALYRVLFQ